jgi:hypothetical protein
MQRFAHVRDQTFIAVTQYFTAGICPAELDNAVRLTLTAGHVIDISIPTRLVHMLLDIR